VIGATLASRPQPVTALPPARDLPSQRDGGRLLVIDPRPAARAAARTAEARVIDLPLLLSPGDLLVVNDAATLPASLPGQDRAGHPVEARLLAQLGDAMDFRALLFGAGDWRTRTEDRPAPPRLARGSVVRFGVDPAGPRLTAQVVAVSPLSPRLVVLRFPDSGDGFWNALYRIGRPVQYAHLDRPLPLWAVQNVYADRPWAFEMPSAGRPLSWSLLQRLRAAGIELGRLTHAAGLSSTGDPDLDARLPLPERFEIPADTAAAIARTRARQGRIVAVGTTVVRALEGAFAQWGQVQAGPGVTDLRLSPSHRLRVVDGLLSGMHQPGESHFDLLGAFAPPALLLQANSFAAARGFHGHELGDSTLILPGASRGQPPTRSRRANSSNTSA
jgi:S-adenosylmethionine:tRNA ribosyltransferase-isomerase